MRRRGRVDENQKAIIDALRQIGATVQPLANVGNGCPDLLVGYRGTNFLMEVKNPAKPIGDQQLTDDQQRWWERWRGQAVIVTSPTAAIAYLQRGTNVTH